jgi:hypothetical protein
MKLSQTRALIEAKKRWGIRARIEHRPLGKALLPFRVGYVGKIFPAFHVEGNGNSWEEAFNDADKARML